ncbi:MAG TPA: hypothetical protein VKR24_00980 [Candidatus Limnocylindrales bacterium]|nr:hypothetical protein [Candidatus Limnocylindrales bacterium]
MRHFVPHLLVLCLGVLVALGAFGLVRAVSSGCNPLSRSTCVRILFVGNSYTFVNDLPTVFRDLARSAGKNVETGMVAEGGETLAQHAASSDDANAISASRWQFVVLQEQSEIPAVESLRQSEMYPAARSLVRAVRATGATPLLLETWAHQAGWPDDGLTYTTMQAAIDDAYGTLAGQLQVGVVPGGQAWQAVVAADPGIVLWQSDGSHPTPAGTFLAACALYTRVFGPCPVNGPDTGGLPASTAATLEAIANQF